MFRKMIIKILEALLGLIDLLGMDLVTLLPKPAERFIDACRASDSRCVSFARFESDYDELQYEGHPDDGDFCYDPSYSCCIGNIYHTDD